MRMRFKSSVTNLYLSQSTGNTFQSSFLQHTLRQLLQKAKDMFMVTLILRERSFLSD